MQLFSRVAAALVALWALGGNGGCSDSSYGESQSNAPQGVAIRLEQVFNGLPAFAAPVAMLQAPGNSTRWFVVEQAGRVLAFANNASVATTTPFVNIGARVTAGGELGLLGMAFHPQFPTDPRAYLFYSHTDATLGLMSRLSEFRSADGGTTLDATSESVLLTILKPSGEGNHNGGGIAFGPDGFLYAGIGDGGGGNDQHPPIGNGQLTSTLLGKMLRIDVSGSTGYGIPPGNHSPAMRCAAQTAAARSLARRSSRSACVIPGAGASTGRAGSSGSPTLARGRSRKSIASISVATTAGAASRVRALPC